MCGLFVEALGVAPADPQQRFLDLGGQSLSGTRLLTRIREQFGVEIPLQELFEGGSLDSLTHAIVNARQREQTPRGDP